MSAKAIRSFHLYSNCFVDLEDPEDLDKALELNGEEMGGVTFTIEKAKPKKGAADREKGKV